MSFSSLPGQVTCIDTGYQRPNFAAAYLLHDQGQAAFIETGTKNALPRLLHALDATGIPRENVSWVIITHIHLDHGGGAGSLLAHLPNARLILHPRGVRHLTDPAKLISGVKSVYGEELFPALFGGVDAVLESRMVAAKDGDSVQVGSRRLTLLDTPGHALHHLCVWDEEAGDLYTGDAFGISYRELDTPQGAFLFPATTPVQFQPESYLDTVRRLAALEPKRLMLTHFGPLDYQPEMATSLIHQVESYARLAQDSAHDDQNLHQRIRAELLHQACGLRPALSARLMEETLAMDMDLNAAGLVTWLQRNSPHEQKPGNRSIPD